MAPRLITLLRLKTSFWTGTRMVLFSPAPFAGAEIETSFHMSDVGRGDAASPTPWERLVDLHLQRGTLGIVASV